MQKIIILSAMFIAYFCAPAMADEDAWQALSKAEEASLLQQIEGMPIQTAYIICDDDDCNALANSLRRVFKKAHWQVTKDKIPFSHAAKGINMWAGNGQVRLVGNMIEKVTDGRLKIKSLKEDVLDEKVASLVITIGEK